MTDILDTVKKALAAFDRDEMCEEINNGPVVDWLRALVAEVERLRRDIEELGAMHNITVKESQDARAEAARLRDLVFVAKRIVLPQIGRGTCWCDIGIGSPMMTTHAPGCLAAQEWNREAVSALERER